MIVSVNAQNLPWFERFQQIEIAKSTQQEVEKVLNFPEVTQLRIGKFSKMVTYKLSFGKATVSYSIGTCSERQNSGYDISEGIVTRIILSISKPIKKSKLKSDLKKFRKYKSSDNNSITYTNEELGIIYVGGEKTISSIEYTIGSKYEYLSCQKPSRGAMSGSMTRTGA